MGKMFSDAVVGQMFEDLHRGYARPCRLMHVTILGCGIFGSVSGLRQHCAPIAMCIAGTERRG